LFNQRVGKGKKIPWCFIRVIITEKTNKQTNKQTNDPGLGEQRERWDEKLEA